LAGVAVAERSWAPDREQRSKGLLFLSPAAHASIFSTLDCKKINQAPSVRVIVICSEHKFLWLDSYKDVDPALTSDESICTRLLLLL